MNRLPGRRKRTKGSSIVETVVGCLFLVPVALFLFDCGVLVLAQTENDRLAKACARAAADCSTAPEGNSAAQLMLQAEQAKLGGSGYLKALTCVVTPDAGWTTVAAETTIQCKLPVPVPFVDLNSKLKFIAKSVEPVVGVMSATTTGGP